MLTKLLKNMWMATLLIVLMSSIAMADSPKSLATPDRHSVEVKGKINLFRVQVDGMNLGEGTSAAKAEVFVTLDSKPGMVYALQINGGTSPTNKVIADTLRDAYINNLPVTLYHQMAIKKDNNFKILMVQLDH